MEENNVENRKRRPLRSRTLVVVVLIAAASLAVTSLFGILSMLGIEKEAESELIEQAKQNLVNIIEQKTELADLRLRKYMEIVSEFTYYVEDIMNDPDSYRRFDLTAPDIYDTGDLVYSFALADETYSWDELKPQAELFANVAHRLYPVVKENEEYINAVFFGFDNGLLLSYDKDSEKVPPELMYFDYLGRDWYPLGKEAEKPTFSDPYVDSFERGITITCVNPIHDRDGNVVGVLGVDMSITDLYDYIIDIDLGENINPLIVGNEKIISREQPDPDATLPEDSGYLNEAEKQRMENYPDGIVVKDNMYLAFGTIKSVGWKLCLRVPQSHVLELAQSIDQKILSSIVIFILFFVIILTTVVVIVFEFSQKITKPIVDLTRDIGEISAGDLDHRAKVYENDEIGDLAKQFNEMTVSLKEHIDSITEMTSEKERIGAELSVATNIQKDMMPKDFPDRSDISLYASMDPAKEIGGDFYDYFMIDDDHIGFVMADVSGKGVPAALFMVIAKTLLKIRASSSCAPSEMLRDVNNTLCKDNAAEMFVTAWFGILTLSTGEIEYVNAGHEYPAIRHKDGGYELVVTENMPPLAVDTNISYKDEIIKLRPGDVLFLYTDGVTDAKSPDGKRFGVDRMIEILNKHKDDDDMHAVLSAVKKRIDVFIDSAEQFDDITMMGILWHGK